MAVEARKPLAPGLNIGADSAQSPRMILADGARFDQAGIITSRFGRDWLSFEFPDEGVGTAADYVFEYPTFSAPTATKGVAAFYDQRIVTTPPELMTEPDFVVTDDWQDGGDWAFSATDASVIYTHAGGSGTLSQFSSDFVQPVIPGLKYTVEVTVGILTNTGNIATFRLDSGAFSGDFKTIPKTSGTHTFELTARKDITISGLSVIATSTDVCTIEIHRISVKPTEDSSTQVVPQRFNLIYKSEGKIYLNDNYPDDGSGIVTGKQFVREPARAKIVTYGQEVFVMNPGDRLLHFRRRAEKHQTWLKRVKYDLREAAINWPLHTSDIARITATGVSADRPPPGLYRCRLVLQNELGDTSNPSLTAAFAFDPDSDNNLVVHFPPLPDGLIAPDATNRVTHWLIYVSYESGEDNAAGIFSTDGAEPTEFRFWKKVTVDPSGLQPTEEFLGVDFQSKNFQVPIASERGQGPRLLDYEIISDVGYGIADVDVLRREISAVEQGGRPLNVVAQDRVPSTNHPTGFRRPLYDNAIIGPVHCDSQYLFFSPPGEPQYLENWIRFGRRDEIGVGLSQLGGKVVIFSNLGIQIFDPETFSLNRVPSEVGCLSRDSIARTEEGIRFIGSDGLPRLFNGATVDSIANELLPIFDKEDYGGDYGRFDRTLPGEVVTTSGERKFYMLYPSRRYTGRPAVPANKLSLAPVPPNKDLAIGDATLGTLNWSVDRARDLHDILWVGRESQLLSVDATGRFFLTEMSLQDAFANSPNVDPPFDWKVRWFGGQVATLSRFMKVKVEINTKGTDVTLVCAVDNTLLQEFTINTTGREQKRFLLPGHFKGLYMETRLKGATTINGRVELYDIQVDRMPMGVF